MNKQRRIAIAEIQDKLSEIRELLEGVKDEEECYLENIPENLQGSERYERAEEAVYNLEEAISSIEEAIEYMESSVG